MKQTARILLFFILFWLAYLILSINLINIGEIKIYLAAIALVLADYHLFLARRKYLAALIFPLAFFILGVILTGIINRLILLPLGISIRGDIGFSLLPYLIEFQPILIDSYAVIILVSIFLIASRSRKKSKS